MNSWVNLHALWKIVVVGLVAGAGLPAVFAVGLRALATPAAGGAQAPDSSTRLTGGNPLGLAVAVVCFAVVVAGIVWGVYLIVNGT